MFRSATVKLTAWYAGIIVVLSLLFSVVIYSTASSEVNTRLTSIQRPIYYTDPARFEDLRATQLHKAESNLMVSLIITNVCIWVAGTVGSYYLAKRTLRPIQLAHEAQSRFTSDASHELRTPLASMKTEVEVALRDPELSNDELRELLRSNLEEVDKLTALSQNLLQLSRLDHEHIKRERVELDTTAKTVIERFKKISPRIELTKTSKLYVRANESNVEQLLTILLDNAVKYSPEDTTIHVALIKRKTLAGFAVTNAGEGIPADKLPHIFDRFYRADTSRTNSSRSGFGLGLALAKKIVELHGGELTVTSAKGKETTFRVLLPIFSKNQALHQ
ncbi:MAG TPA: ATP-binding protein [Candidatus Saccharimonadales bacterium]|nr:ATP-binding protein [Candidatus Saccharimonadales bacterium]